MSGGQCALAHDFAFRDLPLAERLKKQACCAPYHIYGLIRARYLRQYRWYDCDHAADWALIAYLACRGDFIVVPGATFYYHYVGRKTVRAMALANMLRKERPFRSERIAWICASAVRDAERVSGRFDLNRFSMFARIYVWQHRGWKKPAVYSCPSIAAKGMGPGGGWFGRFLRAGRRASSRLKHFGASGERKTGFGVEYLRFTPPRASQW